MSDEKRETAFQIEARQVLKTETTELRDLFTGVGAKTISAVEASNRGNLHQHELNGVAPLKELFGLDKRRFKASFLYYGEETATEEGFVSWYDAREKHPTRSEYRLYYSSDLIPDRAKEGDSLFVCLKADDTVLVVLCTDDHSEIFSTIFQTGDPGPNLEVREIDPGRLNSATSFLLQYLGLAPGLAGDKALSMLLRERFGTSFPRSDTFSACVRELVPLDGRPDEFLLEVMAMEERLFKLMENIVHHDDLKKSYDSVEEMLALAKPIGNRRKARAGRALENHVQHLLDHYHVKYSRGCVTEERKRPDFLFPGAAEYHDPAFPAALLTMLGAKTSLKDRWRQVLDEADRIDPKHLLTLQPDISKFQIQQIFDSRVVLVMPDGLRSLYRDARILSVLEFLELVLQRQRLTER